MNGHGGISSSGDDVDRLPLKISGQTINVAQDYFSTHNPKIKSESKIAVNNGLLSE